jgi:NADH-quinone oxidoreductase subunit M
MNFPILTLIMLAPFAGAIVVLLIPRERGEAIKAVAAGSLAMSLLLSFFVMYSYDSVLGGYQFVEKANWIPSLGITYHMAVDGFAAPQLLLTAVVGFCAVLVSWNQNDRPREYFSFLLALVAGVFGAFMSLDIFVMLIFYELVLFPVYVLVAGWGSKNREYAAMKLTIYLFLGSLVSIVGILAVYFNAVNPDGTLTFNLIELQRNVAAMPDTVNFQRTWFPVVFIGFAVLASIFPLHNWSPDGYAAAPTAVSMLHGGVLKATGAYAGLRFGIQLLPEGAKAWMPILVLLCVAGLIYAAAIAYRQTDLKYIIGFSSVSHLGLVLVGLSAMNRLGLNGAGVELFAGGVMTGLMFSLVGMIYERAHIREVDQLSGLVKVLPLAAVGWVFGALALMGMPGLPGFIAEIQIFMGLWEAASGANVLNPGVLNWQFGAVAIVAVISIIINAAWTLRVAGKIFFSEPQNPELLKLPRLDGLEKFSIVFMCAILLIVGLLPNGVMTIVQSGVISILKSIGLS